MIAETAGVGLEKIQPDTTIRALGVASLDAIEMLFRIEEQFDIQLNDRDVDLKAATATALVKAVERALDKGTGQPVATLAG
jgi:acyl carrier protein